MQQLSKTILSHTLPSKAVLSKAIKRRWHRGKSYLLALLAAGGVWLGGQTLPVPAPISLQALPAQAQAQTAASLPLYLSERPSRQAEDLRPYALDLVNQDRQAHGLRPLVRDPIAEQAAQLHAQDMLRRQFFDHLTPEGFKPRDRYRVAGGASPRLIGENIFWIEDSRLAGLSFGLATYLQKGWMDSPDHRELILTSSFTGFGYGIAHGAGGQLYAVQVFTVPRSPS